MSTPHTQPANWYPDPSGARFLRYWDGAAWTGHTRPAPNAMNPAGAAAAGANPAGMSPAGATPASTMVLYPQQVPARIPVGVWRSPEDSRPLVRNLFDAVRVCVQKYAKFNGRASLPEFWYAHLAYLIVALTTVFIIWIPIVGWLAMLVLWAFAMASIVPLLAVTVRRLTDAGFSWAWIFIALAPFGSIALLIMCAQPSKHP